MKYLPFVPLVLALGGCAATTSGSRPASIATASAPPAVAANQTPITARTPAGDRVLGSREGTVDGGPVRLAITQLTRTGTTTSLGIRFTTRSLYAAIDEALDDGATQPIRNSNSSENGSSLDGIYLIDRAHAQKYLVARDPDNRCICDVNLARTGVTSDAPLNLSATYAAPPPSVSALDVVVPRFGTFANVPLG